jgi:hypothetical protein
MRLNYLGWRAVARTGYHLLPGAEGLYDVKIAPAAVRRRGALLEDAVAIPVGFGVAVKCPRQESNLVLDLRRVACDPQHSEDR